MHCCADSAGINWHEAANERVVQERNSEPSWPKPCEGGREAALEALDRGTCRLCIELRNRAFSGADSVTQLERQQVGRRSTRAVRQPAESNTRACMEALCARTGRPVAGRGQSSAVRLEKAMSYKTQMNCGGESYHGVVLTKHPNQTGRPASGGVEGRPLTKENAEQPN
jgi:hypothetical protein